MKVAWADDVSCGSVAWPVEWSDSRRYGCGNESAGIKPALGCRRASISGIERHTRNDIRAPGEIKVPHFLASSYGQGLTGLGPGNAAHLPASQEDIANTAAMPEKRKGIVVGNDEDVLPVKRGPSVVEGLPRYDLAVRELASKRAFRLRITVIGVGILECPRPCRADRGKQVALALAGINLQGVVVGVAIAAILVGIYIPREGTNGVVLHLGYVG